MPYRMEKQGSKFCVVNKATGNTNGCSDTRKDAVGMMRRLYQVERGAKSLDDPWDAYDLQVPQQQAEYDSMGGIKSGDKACANCQFFDGENGCLVVSGDVQPTGLSKFWEPIAVASPSAPMQVEVTNFDDMMMGGTGEMAVWDTSYINNLPDSSFAYIEPGGSKDAVGKTTPRSKRHFPLKDASGKYDVAHVRNAAARAPQSPFGDKALSAIKAAEKALNIGSKGLDSKIRDWFVGLFTSTETSQSDAAVGLRPIRLTKDIDGRTRATIVFSNNFKDQHDQIIPEVVHTDYLNWVDRTKLYPEFQIWHLGSKSRWGQADCVTRIGHFTIASGLVDPDKEELAEAFARNQDTGVSNGYYALYAPGQKEFAAWWPYEVSALPLTASANVWMGDESVLIGEGFLMKAEHKSFLTSKGVSEQFLQELETDIIARGGTVEGAGVAHKSIDPPEPVPAVTPDLVTMLGTVLDQKITPLIERINQLETGQKSLQADVKKTVDDEILAQVAKLPHGFKATESPDNIVGVLPNGESADPNYDWLGKELDNLMKTNGVGV